VKNYYSNERTVNSNANNEQLDPSKVDKLTKTMQECK